MGFCSFALMVSKRIRFSVWLVSSALLGVFLLQGYWLYNAYGLSAAEFRKAVVDVAARIERQHVRDELTQLTKQMENIKGEKRLKVDSIMLGITDFFTGNQPFRLADSTINTEFRFEFQKSDFVELDSMAQDGVLADTVYKMRMGDSYDYQRPDFEELAAELKTEADSILNEARIRSDFALQLTNISGNGPVWVTDSGTMAAVDTADWVMGRIGLQRPFKMALVVKQDTAYIFRGLLWTLLASVVIVGAVIWAFVLMLRTIYQQKRLSDIKTDFINNMTHEFKTPIATVSLAVEALQRFDVMNNPERAREYLDISRHELHRLSSMVEKVLKMAVYERSDIELTLQSTELGKLVSGVVDNMRPLIEKHQARIDIHAEGNPVVNIDRTHMANVLYNLVENGLKYTQAEQPHVQVNYGATKDGGVWLSVADNGVGIAPAYQKQIFENFFRVPTGNVHNVKGFGLGLGYVAAMVNKHGGHIEVESEPGKGSTFTVTLPGA